MTKSIFKKIWHYFLKYFGQGLLYILPIGVTVIILLAIFQKLDSFFEFETPGLGLLTLILVITVVGVVGSLLISSPVFKYFSRLIEKTPLVKMIYNSIKDLLSVFVGNKKKFTEPVLIKLSENFDTEQIGFITQTDLSDLGITGDKISVYVPYSFSFMGTVYIVPAKNVKPLNVKPQEALKFVVSAGVSKTDEEKRSDKK
jgi:uncharacterized membrane protein